MSGKIVFTDYYGEERQCDSALEALNDGRVFSIKRTGEDGFDFTENCDGCFGLTLTRKQVLQLADELRELANSPYTPPPRPEVEPARYEGSLGDAKGSRGVFDAGYCAAVLNYHNPTTGEKGSVSIPIAGSEPTETERQELIRLAKQQIAASSSELTPPQTR